MKDHALEIEPQAPGSMCLQDLYFPAIEMKSLGGFSIFGNHVYRFQEATHSNMVCKAHTL